MTHGSLFSGIGGFDLAAEWMGWENVFQVEYDKYCQKVLAKNFPNVLRYENIYNVTVDNYGNLLYLCENGDINMGATRLEKYDNAVQLYETGMSIAECAEFYEISRQAMHKILIRRNCKFRKQLKYADDNHFHRGCLPDNTKKKRVQHLVAKAIQKGIIIQPIRCEKCNGVQDFHDGRNGIQAHHKDYDKPFDIMWLCQKCHYEWHKNNNAINETDKEKTGNPSGAVDILSGGFP
jgi:site-specific DNA-cytosine methylase